MYCAFVLPKTESAGSTCQHGSEPSDSVHEGTFLDKLNDCKFLKVPLHEDRYLNTAVRILVDLDMWYASF
jgi:hypothetical protein